MLIIKINPDESIDKLLKKMKQKIDKSGIIKELKNRKYHIKRSEIKRNKLNKAIFLNKNKNKICI